MGLPVWLRKYCITGYPASGRQSDTINETAKQIKTLVNGWNNAAKAGLDAFKKMMKLFILNAVLQGY
jgi:hypothetical protein